MHQADQRAQSAAIDELNLVELQHHVAVLVDRVSHLRVQSIDFIARHNASVTLNDQDLADRAAFQAQLHHASSYGEFDTDGPFRMGWPII